MVELKEENDEGLTFAPVASRHGRPVYSVNPSHSRVAGKIKTSARYLTNQRGEQFTIISEDTGEVIQEGAVFAKKEYVDKQQFVKLFAGAVESITGLNGTGKRLFKVLYQMMLDNPDTDEFYLNRMEISRYDPVSSTTYHRGMEDLIDKKIIFASTIPGKFFINIDFLYNGNRLVKITDYRCSEIPVLSLPSPEEEQVLG